MMRLPFSLSRMSVAVASSVLLAGTAIAQSPAPADSAPQTSGSSSGQSVSRADQKLMTDLAQANLAEIEAGKLALEKSNNEQVKSFAQKMIDDHTQAQQELQQLAQKKNVELPDSTDMKHKATSTALSALSGETFDRQYLQRGGVKDHQEAHQLVSRIQNRARDPELKALGSKLLPTIEQHASMAKDLASAKSGSSGNGSSASGSSGSNREPATDESGRTTSTAK